MVSRTVCMALAADVPAESILTTLHGFAILSATSAYESITFLKYFRRMRVFANPLVAEILSLRSMASAPRPSTRPARTCHCKDMWHYKICHDRFFLPEYIWSSNCLLPREGFLISINIARDRSSAYNRKHIQASRGDALWNTHHHDCT